MACGCNRGGCITRSCERWQRILFERGTGRRSDTGIGHFVKFNFTDAERGRRILVVTNQNALAEMRGVSKRFGGVVALDGLDLEVRRGELLALLGPNGAGKTTSIGLMLGLEQPDAGWV